MWLVMKAPMTEVVYEVNSEMVLTKGQLLFEKGDFFIHSLSVLSVYLGSTEINIKMYIHVYMYKHTPRSHLLS